MVASRESYREITLVKLDKITSLEVNKSATASIKLSPMTPLVYSTVSTKRKKTTVATEMVHMPRLCQS